MKDCTFSAQAASGNVGIMGPTKMYLSVQAPVLNEDCSQFETLPEKVTDSFQAGVKDSSIDLPALKFKQNENLVQSFISNECMLLISWIIARSLLIKNFKDILCTSGMSKSLDEVEQVLNTTVDDVGLAQRPVQNKENLRKRSATTISKDNISSKKPCGGAKTKCVFSLDFFHRFVVMWKILSEFFMLF